MDRVINTTSRCHVLNKNYVGGLQLYCDFEIRYLYPALARVIIESKNIQKATVFTH